MRATSGASCCCLPIPRKASPPVRALCFPTGKPSGRWSNRAFRDRTQIGRMKRSAIVAGLVLAMVLFGFGVYHAAAFLKADRPMVHRPSEISAPAVPGTLYLVQAGAIYRFQHGQFTQITPESGWTQPSLSPDGHQMVAVQRHTNYSDLYLLNPSGKTIQQ